MRGGFQSQNLETALTTVSRVEMTPEDIEDTLENVNCPGRMEKISDDPETVLDGAHNVEALEKTVKYFEEGFTYVFSAIESKEIGKMIDVIEENASRIYITTSEFRMAEKPEKIEEKTSIKSEIFRDPAEALERAQQESSSQVVVTGSLYLIGDLKKHLEQEA
jgi:dihydrofolate synthase/folylpolyglutamate synthase